MKPGSDDMECPNCNKTYDDDFKFCPHCGTKKPEGKICPGCKYESYEFDFCPKCGRQLIEKHVYDELNMLFEKINDLHLFYEKINDKESLKKYEEILECAEKAIELAPSYEVPWAYKGDCLEELGRYEEAIECYDITIELIPSGTYSFYNQQSWLDKGNCFEKLGRYEEALECYEKIYKLDPYDDYIWLRLGECLEKLGRHEEAEYYLSMGRGLAECEMIADRLNEEYLNENFRN